MSGKKKIESKDNSYDKSKKPQENKMKVKEIKQLLDIDDSSEEEKSSKKDMNKNCGSEDNNCIKNNISQEELKGLKENIDIVLEEDFPEDIELEEDKTDINDYTQNINNIKETQKLAQKMDKLSADEKKFTNIDTKVKF